MRSVAGGADGETRAAMRATVRGDVQGVGFRDATVRRARELAVMGWVRNGEDGTVRVHGEGAPAALRGLTTFLQEGPRSSRVAGVEVVAVPVEGHEQFAVRGVRAGCFVVGEHAGGSHGFDLLLEVDGAMRVWTLPRGPSMDPAVKRLAVQQPDRPVTGTCDDGALEAGSVIVWDRGTYEQGGRVAWPEALERGHAVFVLHGTQLRGGFALQRTRPGAGAQWLLVKRREG